MHIGTKKQRSCGATLAVEALCLRLGRELERASMRQWDRSQEKLGHLWEPGQGTGGGVIEKQRKTDLEINKETGEKIVSDCTRRLRVG